MPKTEKKNCGPGVKEEIIKEEPKQELQKEPEQSEPSSGGGLPIMLIAVIGIIGIGGVVGFFALRSKKE